MELEPFIDETGEERRCGSLPTPEGLTCAFPTFESTFEVWDDQQIRRVITDPDRVPSRVLFGPEWNQNQRSHGSCNGFAEANVYGKARRLRGIMDKRLFSGAFAYSLMNGGRDQGSVLEHGMRNLPIHGVCYAETVPWNQIYPHQQPAHAKAEALKHRGLVVFKAETLQGLRTGLAKRMPAVIAVHAGRNFQRLNSQGIAGVDSGGGNHSVHADDLCIIGGQEVFDHENSWGLGYGTNGRSYLTTEHFAQTFRNHTFYLVGSTEEADG